MKKLNLILVMMLLFSGSVFSQWNTGGNTWNAYGATNWNLLGTNNIRSIGIGHKQMFGGFIPGWTNSNPPRAALHVNAHYLSNSPAFEPGHMIRTDGPSNQDNMWQMFTGTNYNNSTEKARLSVPANTNDLVIQASQPFGTLRFRLGLIQRMILKDGLGQVHLGIGNNFSDPQHMIHIHTTPIIINFPPLASMIGFTHNLTGATATDGFLVGIASDGSAELRQQEDLPIRIFTNEGSLHEQRMIISHDASLNVPRVGIGTAALLNPRTYLHIGQDINETGFGYREWMNVGELVVADKSDNMYFGLARSGHIINWGSEQSIENNNNRLRFVNTTGDNSVQSGNYLGIEVACMISDGNNGFMGIGNFSGNLEPTQTLDVTGNARLRTLPNDDFHNENLTKCVVVDDDGVLYWRDFGGGGTTLRDNNQDFVGIGTKNPIAGLEVANGDIAVTTNASGIILKTNNGENYYRILVDDNGNLYTEKVDFN